MDMLPSCPCQRAERAAVAIAADLADAWGAIADDVAPAADRHVAGARVGRMMFTRFRGWFGHPMPATVVSCTVSIVSRIGSPRVLHEAADHLLLVTDRAYVDLGLAPYQSRVDAPVVACAERTVRWPKGDAVLNLPLAAAVVRYGRTTTARTDGHRGGVVRTRSGRRWRNGSITRWIVCSTSAACIGLVPISGRPCT